MSNTMSIVGDALMACFLEYGEMTLADPEIKPLHKYTWTETFPDGTKLVLPCQWADHLLDHPNPNTSGWNAADQTTSGVIAASARDTLYIGGGAGRFARYIQSLGHTCHSIDTAQPAVDLMRMRGLTADAMDAHAMSFADNSYPLVVVAYGLLGISENPAALLAEACRVASERVIVTEWSHDGSGDPYEVGQKLEWNGLVEEWTAKAHSFQQALEWLAAAGFPTLIRRHGFLDNPFDRTEKSWVVEVGT